MVMVYGRGSKVIVIIIAGLVECIFACDWSGSVDKLAQLSLSHIPISILAFEILVCKLLNILYKIILPNIILCA